MTQRAIPGAPARGAAPRAHVRRPCHTAGESGSMSVFVVVFSVAVFLLAGLLVDGGAAINARLRAADIAEQAARAAADHIDVATLRNTGRIVLSDDGEVCGRAEEIVAAHQGDGVRMTACEVGGGRTEVTVGVAVHWNALFLGALGVTGSDMTAAVTAAPETGET